MDMLQSSVTHSGNWSSLGDVTYLAFFLDKFAGHRGMMVTNEKVNMAVLFTAT
jgi:hypothetical protein